MSDLYLPEGWLNFDYIIEQPAWLIVIIGKRQVGKTYGALKAMLKYDKQHILLRRTTAELETISASPDLNPYKVFEPDYYVGLFKSGKKLCRICNYFTDQEGRAEQGKQRGIATSLAEIAHIRGFNGSLFTDLVYDEFIPEKGVVTRRTEGEAFLNAYTTINGNRELSGKPPLRAWLLANTNNISSAVLEALNLTDDILYMRRKGKEQMLTDDGVLIIQPSSEKITELRKETALMKRVNQKSEFYGMAIENEWAYDQSPYVKNLSLKNMQPVLTYDENFSLWKNSSCFYMCRSKAKVPSAMRYDSSKTGKETFARDHAYLVPAYYAGILYFSDLRCLSLFKMIFSLD